MRLTYRFALLAISVLTAFGAVPGKAQPGPAETPQDGPNYVVLTLGDTDDTVCGIGDCTLREAINAANTSADISIITFDATAFATAQTITLAGTQLPPLIADTAINGPNGPTAGVTISGNSASRVFQVTSGNASFTNLNITGSRVTGDGGGLYNIAGTVTVSNCTFYGNAATNGGGLYNDIGTLTLNNCTLAYNTVNSSGGGVANLSSGILTVNNSTIATNTSNSGGGIANSGTLVIGNTILATNNGGNLVNTVGTVTSNGYNLSTTNQAALLNQPTDQNSVTNPRLDAVTTITGFPGLSNNGGPTLTIKPLIGSPALDQGQAQASATLDQRLLPRPVDLTAYANASGGDGSDIGSYEVQDVVQGIKDFVVTNIRDADDGVCSNSDCSLREAIVAANGNSNNSIITFDARVFTTALTITLGGAQLPSISSNTTITGPNVGVTLDANDLSRVMYLYTGTVSISRLTFTNGNSGGSFGGGIYNFESNATLTNCTVTGNQGTFGGGIFIQSGGRTTLNNSTVSNNQATNGGGVYNTGFLIPDKSTISGNQADNTGGGVFNVGVVFASNSTIANNTATNGGGGFYNNGGFVSVLNCTVANNTAGFGGGFYNNDGDLEIGSTILSNSGGNISQNGATTVVSDGYNLSSDNQTLLLNQTSDQNNTDPKLDPAGLQNNGGTTQTIKLQTGSPAIDQGKNQGVFGDQRSLTRPIDFPGIANPLGGDGSDIGAYEVQDSLQTTPNFVVNVVTDTNDGSCGAANCSLREAINVANANSDTSTITFDPVIFATARTINLNNTLPTLSTNINITGPTAGVTVDANGVNGAFQLSGSIVNLSRLTITEGNATQGGGIAKFGGSLTITDCTLSNNTASFVGGGLYSSSGPVTINSSTVSGNTATSGSGGGIYSVSGPLTLNNSTLANNSAPTASGGAIYKSGGTVALRNCTVAGNSATDGGGVFSGGTLTLSNTILANTGGNISSAGTVTSQGYNLSSDDQSAFLNQTGDKNNTDPLLDTMGLQNNGGLTPTIALQPSSPAINAGRNTLIPLDSQDADGDGNTNELAPYDQRGPGFNRIQGTSVDIGAFEIPVLDIAQASVVEGDSGNTTLLFTITLSEAYNKPITVTYQTAGGSATAGTDYVAVPPTALTFAAGQTVKTVPVTVKGDNITEANERLTLALSNPANAAIGTVISGIIADDDPANTLSVDDISVTEGNGGTVQAIFTVTLTPASSQTVTVVAQSSNKSGDPAATPNVDYTVLAPTTITFDPGQTTKTVSVSILGDLRDEADEKFTLSLSNAVNATLIDNTGVGTIVDNDTAPAISVSAPNVIEGNGGSTNMTFTISLSVDSERKVSVQYKTETAATLPATAGTDYTAVPITTVIFLPGETTKTVNVSVKGDTLDEANEHILLALSNPFNATIGTVNDGIIVDDDAAPSLSINDVDLAEGNSGTSKMIFTVTLSAASGQTVTVNASTGNGGTPAATAGNDYVAQNSTPVTFAPGQTTRTVEVTINGDTTVEPNEKLGIILSGAVNATISDNSGLGRILNDDAAGVVAPTPAPTDEPSK